MKRYSFMVTVLSALLTLMCSVAARAANSSSPAYQQNSSQGYKIAFVVGLVIAIWGLYRSKKQSIVVFANLTDVLATLAVPVLAFVMYMLCQFMGLMGKTEFMVTFVPPALIFLSMYKATRAYNKSIGAGFLGALHALFTKLFIVGLYIVALVAIVQFGGGGRKKYEHRSTYERRARRQIAAGMGAASVVFALLTFVGLWESNFVSIDAYLSGVWDDGQQEDEETYEQEA